MNSKTRKRREFIKLASGLMVTPFASLAGGSASAQSTKPPLRILTIIDSFGVPVSTRNEVWVKSTAGDYALKNSDLGTILSPLQAYKDNMLIASGINLDSLDQTRDSRSHDAMCSHTLSGSRKTGGTRKADATILHASIDVHIGQYLNDDYGLKRAYPHLFFTNYEESGKRTYCHDASGNQIRPLGDAQKIASTIFGTPSNSDELQFNNSTQQRVFELVQQQIQGLRGKVENTNANVFLDAYHSSVNDLAAQLQLSSNNVCEIPGQIETFPDSSERESSNSTPYIFKNIKQALACNLTSSLTYAVGGATFNNMTHADLYNEEEHSSDELRDLLGANMHSASHQVTDVANKTHELIRIHQSEEIAALLDDMSVMPDVDGNSVLDNTVIFWTSAMSSNTHEKENYPYLLIAGKNTNLKGGFHYDCTDSTNNDLLTTIAQGLYLPDDHFGGHDNTGKYLNALNNGPISKMLVS